MKKRGTCYIIYILRGNVRLFRIYNEGGKALHGAEIVKYLFNNITSPTHDPPSLKQLLQDVYEIVTTDSGISHKMKSSKLLLRLLSFAGFHLLDCAAPGDTTSLVNTVNRFVTPVAIVMRLIYEGQQSCGFSVGWLNKVRIALVF